MKVNDFDKLHGDDAIVIGAYLHFSDGAYRETHPHGAMVTPNDPYKIAKLILLYWQAKLNLAVDEFTSIKRNLLARTNACQSQRHCDPPPDQSAINRLRELEKKVNGLKTKVQEAKENLEQSKPEDLRRREKSDVDCREKCRVAKAEILSIEV